MKIGIYGDSFTACGEDKFRWGNLLKEQYSTDNYGCPATSLDWSVLQFDNTQSQYDKVIFVVTQPERLYIPRHPSLNHWTVYSQSENLINNLSKYEKKHFKQFIEFYVKYMIDDSTMLLKQKTLTTYVRTIRPDALLIPAFYNTVPDSQYISLYEVSLLDSKNEQLLRLIEFLEKQNGGDVRPCHMNPTNNAILCDKIVHWLNTGNFLLNSIDDFFTPKTLDDLLSINQQFLELYRTKQQT